MNRSLAEIKKEYPEIAARLTFIERSLVETFHPEAIFLFGSYAWGKPTEGSDIDIFVLVKNSELSQADRIRQGFRSLIDLRINLDLLVMTEAEIAPRIDHPSTLTHRVFTEGIKLYEAA